MLNQRGQMQAQTQRMTGMQEQLQTQTQRMDQMQASLNRVTGYVNLLTSVSGLHHALLRRQYPEVLQGLEFPRGNLRPEVDRA